MGQRFRSRGTSGIIKETQADTQNIYRTQAAYFITDFSLISPASCKLVGYKDDSFVVIDVNGQLHTIHIDCLLDMQSSTRSKHTPTENLAPANSASSVLYGY